MCIKLEINQGYTTMQEQPTFKFCSFLSVLNFRRTAKKGIIEAPTKKNLIADTELCYLLTYFLINYLTISSVMLLPVFMESIPIQFGIMRGALPIYLWITGEISMSCGAKIEP